MQKLQFRSSFKSSELQKKPSVAAFLISNVFSKTEVFLILHSN